MSKPIIAVFGATGSQGGSVVRYLKDAGQFRVRALTRNPAKYNGPADEAVGANLDDEQSLTAALQGAYGVFVVTNFWQEDNNEFEQARKAIAAAKTAGVEHFVWSSLPNVETISQGKWSVPHFTDKARVEPLVKSAGFPIYTVVRPSFYFENLFGTMAPADLGDGRTGWAIPIDPDARVIHMGAIAELGNLVSSVFAKPKDSNDKTLSMAAGLYSFNDIVEEFAAVGKSYSLVQVPHDVYAGAFPGADEIGQMLGYFEDHSYMGPDSGDSIAAANAIVDTAFKPLDRWLKEQL